MNMPLVLLNRRRRGGAAAFSPTRLFALAEPGVWYDPSDLTTLFQDTAGTQPVTTPGQTVALALDKSKGLVLGSELVTNGTFDSGVTSWTVSAQCSIGSGIANIISTDGSFQSIVQNRTLTGGSTYELSFDVVSYTSGTPRFTFTGASVDISFATGTGRRVARFFVPTTVTSGLTFTRLVGVTSYSIDNISVRELPGFHATQATLASRPTYQVISGRPCLVFDGVDDFLITPTITPGVDKAQVFAGVRKLSDAAAGLIVESSTAVVSNAGSFAVFGPQSAASATYLLRSRGSSAQVDSGTAGVYAAPITNVLTGLGDISGDIATLRVNGTQAAQATTDQGAGNYLAYPLYIGRRGGTTLPFNGQIYSLTVRFGANLDSTSISSMETWVAGKTGVTL